jgi:hypothetical protein
MKKLQIFVIAVFAVAAFSAVVVTSAFAEEEAATLLAEFLAGTKPITENLATDTIGELLLSDDNVPIIKTAAVVCSGLFEGTVDENGEDEIHALFSLGGTLIPTTGETGFLVEGSGLLCKAESPAEGCEASETDIEVFAINLPYLSTLLLVTSGSKFVDMVKSRIAGKEVGYEVMCLVLGSLVEDECKTAEEEGEVVNVTGGVEGVGFATPNANCTEGGAGAGLIFAIPTNKTTLTNGETLTVSE